MPTQQTEDTVLHPLTDEHVFVSTLQEQYERFHLPVPKELMQTHFSELNYSARIAAIVKLTKGRGFPMSFDEFNNLVNGRFKTSGVFEAICSYQAAFFHPDKKVDSNEKI